MSDFKLRKHSVREAFFIEKMEKEKKHDMEVGVEGGISIPRDEANNRHIAIKLKFHLGSEEERLYLTMETLSIFEPASEKVAVNKEIVQKQCLPIALLKLRNTVKNVTEAYGMPPLDLPPFEEENMGE